MATYAIGDIHGRFKVLKRLLERIEFRPESDTLWLVGDLVNVGPKSLKVLRWAMDLPNVVVTLGNHDLHMLAVYLGVRDLRPKDTFQSVLDAPDADDIFAWLRRQKLVHRQDGYIMVHAGLLPQWTPDKAVEVANEVERMLCSPHYPEFFDEMYGNKPKIWSDELTGNDRLRIAVNAFTRSRIVRVKDGRLEFDFKGEPQDTPKGYAPWYELFDAPGETLLFGHWSAHGFYESERVVCLDSGCAWKRKLTAMRLSDRAVFQVSAG